MFCLLELSVLFFSDGCLDLIKTLFHEATVLHVKNAIGVALNIRVVSNHNASCRCMFSLTLRTDSINVQNQIHDCNYTD